jgi:ribosomal subunit interface protein
MRDSGKGNVMKVQIHGKQMDVGEALRGHAENRLVEMVSKYSARPVEAVVTFSRDRHEFACDATVHLSTGMKAQARGLAGDIYDCLDAMLERMETQMRRYKRRLKNHHVARPAPFESSDAASYVISGASAAEEPESLQPVIIAEMSTSVPSISVGEAVMQLELSHADMLVFRNEAHGRINVVHRRGDGNFGWIDPQDAT